MDDSTQSDEREPSTSETKPYVTRYSRMVKTSARFKDYVMQMILCSNQYVWITCFQNVQLYVFYSIILSNIGLFSTYACLNFMWNICTLVLMNSIL